MTLAFGDSIAILIKLGVITASLATIAYFLLHRLTSRPTSKPLSFATVIVSMTLIVLIGSAIREGSIEYNPLIKSPSELVGYYEGDGYSLRLNADGSYRATGFGDVESGDWTNEDWNLTLSTLKAAQPRVIKHNGKLCIAPHYSGVDSHYGALLKKQ